MSATLIDISEPSNDFSQEKEDTSALKRKRQRKVEWTKEQDEQLLRCVKQYGHISWKRISKFLLKSEVRCHNRYLELTNASDKLRSTWSVEEDKLLRKCVEKMGAKNWTIIATHLPGRIGRQCRDRWIYNLQPGISRRAWSTEDDQKVIDTYLDIGPRWIEIAK